MVKRGSSIGFFGRFGRSEDMRRIDEALRNGGLHPAQISEGAKLAAVGLMSGGRNADPPAEAYPPVGEMMAYCALGETAFAYENGDARTATVRQRLEAALDGSEGLDAEIILLMLHARLIHPQLVERYDIRADEGD